MKTIIVSFLTLLVISSNQFAQTVINGTVTDSLNKPIPYANVFIINSTIGTSTDINGKYSLTVPQDGYYQLSVSCVGYNSIDQNLYADGQKQTINLILSVSYITINEVTIKASDQYKKRYYNQFAKQFIGDTHNSRSCKLLNPEDLHIYRDNENDILKGFSVKPLKIENEALGYTIVYNLTDFAYDPNNGILKFAGNHYFQTLEGSSRKNKKWELNRLFSYYGSRMHFIRSLYSDSLFNEGFKLSEFEIDTSITTKLELKAIQARDIILKNDQISKTVFNKEPLQISFTNNHPELVYSAYGYIPEIYISALIFSDSVSIYQNGLFENPFSVTWDGAMTNERLADMLPFEYWPNQIEKGKNNNSGERAILKDEVFVHTDRNFYSPADTIHFQAYIRDKISGEFESASNSMYALLFNEQKEIADSSRFKIEDAVSSGWMAIPKDAKSGKYRFVAFTGMMQNDDPKDAFQLDLRVNSGSSDSKKALVSFSKNMYLPGDTIEAYIKITDLKDEPIRNQKFISSILTGNSTIEMDESPTDRKGESVIRFTIPDTITSSAELQIVMNKKSDNSSIAKQFKIPFNDRYLEFRFLPEGGNLIEGLEQRIGFNATNNMGEPIIIEGLLKNSSGSILDTIRSGEYGPGIFSCIAQKGMYVELITEAYLNKKFQLPIPDPSGICLRVRPNGSRSFVVEIQATKYTGQTVIVEGNMNGSIIFSQELKLDKKKRITINTDELPAGALQISLFDAGMKPVAERLFYVNADKHLKFDITSDTSVYEPGQETELNVSVIDGQGKPETGYFSISVIDAISGNDAELFTPGIEYTFNYHPYFTQNLPPKVLLEGLENLTDEQRDLLLMVYGWRKIHWEASTEDTINKNTVNYDLLNMKILYALGWRKSDRKLSLFSLEGLSVRHLITDANGEISMPLDSLDEETRSIVLMPDNKNRKRVWGSEINIPYNEQYFKSEYLFKSIKSIPQNEFIHSSAYYDISTGDSLQEIPEVTITGHSKRVFNDQFEEYFKNDYMLSIANEPLWSMPSLFAAVKKLAPFAITNQMDQIILDPNINGNPAAVIIDGTYPHFTVGWSLASAMSPYRLKSLTIVLSTRGNPGIIFVNSLLKDHDPKLAKRYNDWAIKFKKDKLLLPFIIYRPYKEFYNPGKIELDINPFLKESSTFFWQSEVHFDGKEPVKIKFPNLNRQGTVMITINGVSENNLSGCGKAIYRVQNSIKK